MTRELDLRNVSFLAAMHLLAVAGIVYVATTPVATASIILAVAWYLASGLGITGGYHRLFSHPTYKANGLVKGFLLASGAAAFQNSALKWSSDHRMHHAHTDEELDPYNIQKGFWWAHIGWIFYKDEGLEEDLVRDLKKDRMLMWQHRYYVPVAVFMTFALPALLGFLWGDALGAFLLAGPVRLVVQWHATFTINSLAHWMGRRPYDKRISARDSAFVALVTMGEGYHNFHHRFPGDYRNGIRWYQFDLTKWVVGGLSYVGFTRDLKRTPEARIERAKSQPRETTAPAEVPQPEPAAPEVSHTP